MELCRALRDRWHPFGVGVFMGSTQMRKIGSCFVFLIDVKTWMILAFEKYQNLSAKCNARVFLWRGCALSAFSHNWHERFGETTLNTGQFPCRGCLQVFSCLVSQLKGCQMWQKVCQTELNEAYPEQCIFRLKTSTCGDTSTLKYLQNMLHMCSFRKSSSSPCSKIFSPQEPRSKNREELGFAFDAFEVANWHLGW